MVEDQGVYLGNKTVECADHIQIAPVYGTSRKLMGGLSVCFLSSFCATIELSVASLHGLDLSDLL